jgi:branched-chain amino acid transport system ATP-binding protein
VAELLERFGLAGKAGLAVAQLSHGEQRRLEVAVALAGRPKVLMLDEPTQGMSHGDTEDTAVLIRSLAAEVTVLLIEHDIGLVMNLSDHCVECRIRNGPSYVAVATALAPLRTNFRDH